MGEKKSFIDVDKMNLPKGGGAYSGLGENLDVDGFTGDVGFHVPLYCPPCRDYAPRLALQYQASNGQGVWGMGFSLEIPTISRQTQLHIPRYDDDKDVFVHSSLGEI